MGHLILRLHSTFQLFIEKCGEKLDIFKFQCFGNSLALRYFYPSHPLSFNIRLTCSMFNIAFSLYLILFQSLLQLSKNSEFLIPDGCKYTLFANKLHSLKYQRSTIFGYKDKGIRQRLSSYV